MILIKSHKHRHIRECRYPNYWYSVPFFSMGSYLRGKDAEEIINSLRELCAKRFADKK